MMATFYKTGYLPATNTRGSRVRVWGASSGAHIGTVGFRHELGGGEEQYRQAVIEVTGDESARVLFQRENNKGFYIVTGESK